MKVLIIGDSGVGKSCILERFNNRAFKVNHIPTIAIDFTFKTLRVRDKAVRLQIWDTAGQERFNTLTANFFKATHGILLCFSLTDRASFVNVTKWLNQVKALAPKEVTILLVGNKKDLQDQREVKAEEGKHLAQENGIEYVETSACSGEGIDESFTLLADRALQILDAGSGEGEKKLQLDGGQQQGGCCKK